MLKRCFDIVISSVGLIVLSPILACFAFYIWKGDKGSIFYCAPRTGKKGSQFRIYKFRTMFVDSDLHGSSSTPEDDPRITKIGVFLRKYKLDELPQFINVLKGEMSLVGPRPQVLWATERYNEQEKLLLTVRPGMTDLASIHFRNEGEILKGSKNPDKDYLEKIAPEKTRLGLKYIEKSSFWFDFKIIAATLWAIMGGDPRVILREI